MDGLKEIGGTGEVARLFPVLSESSKEGRTLSILLASLVGVPEFANAILQTVGRPVGKRTTIEAFTEVSFPKSGNGKCRPDGLIVVKTGHSVWRAFVEAKVGNASVSNEQLSTYLNLAKEVGVDAVITITNDYTASPDQHPLQVNKKLLKKTALFHFSWFTFLTALNVLSEGERIDDREKRFLLNELERFLIHPSAGLQRFTRMGESWTKLLERMRGGLSTPKSSEEVKNVITSWHSELNDLCLLLTRKTGEIVDLKLPARQRGNAEERIAHDSRALVEQGVLRASLVVPNAAVPLNIEADLKSRTLIIDAALIAPKDRVRQSSRLNWLLRQLEEVEEPSLLVQSHWPGKAPILESDLSQARSDNPVHCHPDPKVLPTKFVVVMRLEDGRKFSGRNTFISELEDLVLRFYDVALSNLRAWQPPAPTLRKAVEEIGDGEVEF